MPERHAKLMKDFSGGGTFRDHGVPT